MTHQSYMNKVIFIILIVLMCAAPRMIGEHVTIDYDHLGDVIEFESYVFPRNYQWESGYDAYEQYILTRCDILLRQVASFHRTFVQGRVIIYLYPKMHHYYGMYMPGLQSIGLSLYELKIYPGILTHELSHHVQHQLGITDRGLQEHNARQAELSIIMR